MVVCNVQLIDSGFFFLPFLTAHIYNTYDVLFVDDHPSTVSIEIIHAVGDSRMLRGNIAHTLWQCT